MTTTDNGSTEHASLIPPKTFAHRVADELSGTRLIDNQLVGWEADVSGDQLDLVNVRTTVKNFTGPDEVEHWRLWVTSVPGDEVVDAAPVVSAVNGVGAMDQPGPDAA